ncbi:hypothetical protein F4823DRAFT_634265 [Ustulina deusta]|nr:hypothetical protein F4823DRAFT_634265 [Ustulina deusta]
MHFTSLLLTALAATVANSYRVDPSLEDGVYFIPLLTNSSKFLQSESLYAAPIRIGDAVLPNALPKRSVVGKVPIPTDTRKCYQATESRVDHDGAYQILSKACDSGTKVPHQHMSIPGMLVARYASSLAFVCSWGHSQGCAPNEIDDAWSQISKNCGGDLESGHISASRWKKCYGHTFEKHPYEIGAIAVTVGGPSYQQELPPHYDSLSPNSFRLSGSD